MKGSFNASVAFGTPLIAADTSTTVSVVRSFDLSVVSLWSDAAGDNPIGNPHTLASDGKILFYADPGIEYTITVSNSGVSATFENHLIQSEEQPGRTESSSFTVSAGDANQFIETTGASMVVTVPTDTEDPDIEGGFMIHGHHQNASPLTFTGATILVNSDLTASVDNNGCWTLTKSRVAADTWLLYGYLGLV